MKLVTFTYRKRRRVGEMIDDTIYELAWPDTMRQMVRRGLTAGRAYERFPIDQVDIEAPLQPGKIIGIGLNYGDHAAETGKQPPAEPLVFAKLPSSVIGPDEPIMWRPAITQQVDWEVELGVVIGKRARAVSPGDAYDHIFGYIVANDITARDLQDNSPGGQWISAKGMDTFCPLGPCLVTRSDIEDPHALALKTTVNGAVMQDGNTRDMLFKIPDLIAYCSQRFTLEPGDVLLTGTPAGVGRAKNPPRFLADGDTVTVSVEGIGAMTNTCRVIAEAAAEAAPAAVDSDAGEG
ncbi:MAG: fumarylacetoacetate hydrolase family protein, partial [Chloroflexi bacterium]|nr:fumarylacetoacetate hydrolase family protein [Chloroflexota bacterium]